MKAMIPKKYLNKAKKSILEKNNADKENRLAQLKNVLFESDLMGQKPLQKCPKIEKIIRKQQTASKKMILKQSAVNYFSRNQVATYGQPVGDRSRTTMSEKPPKAKHFERLELKDKLKKSQNF